MIFVFGIYPYLRVFFSKYVLTHIREVEPVDKYYEAHNKIYNETLPAGESFSYNPW